MSEKERRDFCIECRKDTEYLLQKRDIVKNIKDKEYTFSITVAVCVECGEEMSIPGLVDKNVREIDEQYRAVEGLVSIEDIEKLMKIYKCPIPFQKDYISANFIYLQSFIPCKVYDYSLSYSVYLNDGILSISNHLQ